MEEDKKIVERELKEAEEEKEMEEKEKEEKRRQIQQQMKDNERHIAEKKKQLEREREQDKKLMDEYIRMQDERVSLVGVSFYFIHRLLLVVTCGLMRNRTGHIKKRLIQ
jgi:L-lactate utilization protein LutB